MGFCKWRFDTRSVGIQEGRGSGAHCFPDTGLQPPPQAAGLQSLRQSPLTQPHLLVPRPDTFSIVAARLFNAKMRFSFSISNSVCFCAAWHLWVESETIHRILTSPSKLKLTTIALVNTWRSFFYCSPALQSSAQVTEY